MGNCARGREDVFIRGSWVSSPQELPVLYVNLHYFKVYKKKQQQQNRLKIELQSSGKHHTHWGDTMSDKVKIEAKSIRRARKGI